MHSAHKEWEALSDISDLIKPQSTNRKDFIQECKTGKLDGVVAAYRTFGSVNITGLIDEELVNALPKSWKYLAHNGKVVVLLIIVKRSPCAWLFFTLIRKVMPPAVMTSGMLLSTSASQISTQNLTYLQELVMTRSSLKHAPSENHRCLSQIRQWYQMMLQPTLLSF